MSCDIKPHTVNAHTAHTPDICTPAAQHRANTPRRAAKNHALGLLCGLLMLALPACGLLDPGPPRSMLVLQPQLPLAAAHTEKLNVQLGVAQVESSSALATSRIAVLSGRQISYLPDIQWADPAPRQIQSLLVYSLAASGRLAGIGGDGNMAFSDYQLRCVLESFHLTADAPQGAHVSVSVALQLIGRDGRVVDYTRIQAERPCASGTQAAGTHDKTDAMLDAFDDALAAVLGDATGWVLQQVAATEASRPARR